jgi:hypothetical protein
MLRAELQKPDPIAQLLADAKPVVLIFLANTTELHRFALGGALDPLVDHSSLRFVYPSAEAA